MLRRTIILAAAALVATAASSGQDESDRLSFYIDSQFQAAVGELPKLAWFLPDGTVAAQDTAPAILLYSHGDRAHPARLKGALSQSEIAALRPKYHVACDVMSLDELPTVSLYTTLAQPAGTNPQLLSTTKALPSFEAGFEKVPLRGRAETEVWKEMRPVDANQPRQSVMIRRKGLDFSYSLAALYSGPNREVTRIGLFLHAPEGKIMAAHIGNIHGDWCDGCATPTYAEGIERIYSVENMFTAASFAYPLLMLDASTVEARAISLVTFTPSREYSRRLFFEYVVGCSK
jgi:hypothetical protein